MSNANWISNWISNGIANKNNDIMNNDRNSPETNNKLSIIVENDRNSPETNDIDKRDTERGKSSPNYKFQTGDCDKLIALVHSSRCRKGSSCKIYGQQCSIMQKSYVHSKKCKSKNGCDDQYCNRAVLRHFAECQDILCTICNRVRSVCMESSDSPRKSRGIITS